MFRALALATVLALFFESQCYFFKFPKSQPGVEREPAYGGGADYEAMKKCLDINVDFICSPDFYSEKVSIALQCANEGRARLLASQCAKNENSEYCFTASGMLGVEFPTILSVLMSSGCPFGGLTTTCPTSCRDLILSLKNSLGCCLNSGINSTDNPVRDSTPYGLFSYSLWQACDVEPPPSCKNGPAVPPTPSDAQICTTEELTRKFAEYECSNESASLQPLVDALLKDSRCSGFVSDIATACGINENGQYCSEVIASKLLIITLQFLCPDITSCSGPARSRCRQTLQRVKSEIGCCLEVVKQFMFREYHVIPPSYTNEMWRACDVEYPGACKSSLDTAETNESPEHTHHHDDL